MPQGFLAQGGHEHSCADEACEHQSHKRHDYRASGPRGPDRSARIRGNFPPPALSAAATTGGSQGKSSNVNKCQQISSTLQWQPGFRRIFGPQECSVWLSKKKQIKISGMILPDQRCCFGLGRQKLRSFFVSRGFHAVYVPDLPWLFFRLSRSQKKEQANRFPLSLVMEAWPFWFPCVKLR